MWAYTTLRYTYVGIYFPVMLKPGFNFPVMLKPGYKLPFKPPRVGIPLF